MAAAGRPEEGSFLNASMEEVYALIENMLMKLIGYNDKFVNSCTRFHSAVPPVISVGQYLARFIKYAHITPCTLIAIIVYIDRVAERHSDFVVNSYTIHRFLLAAIVCGAKSMSDLFLSNQNYSKVGGVSPRELSMLEFDFLEMIEWNLNIRVEEFERYYITLKNYWEKSRPRVGVKELPSKKIDRGMRTPVAGNSPRVPIGV